MIVGIGVDMASVERLEKSMQRESFGQKIFSDAERAMLAKFGEKHRAQSVAANFAAKEAFLKAVGTGLSGFDLAELAVLRHESGEPYFALTGRAADHCRQNGLAVHVSLTHEGGFATAFVVLEKTGGEITYL